MDIIAYYLSEYDINAVEILGYSSRTEAFEKIGQNFWKNNNYLKRLRILLRSVQEEDNATARLESELQ